MDFLWDRFDAAFLKEIIKNNDNIEDKELYLESDDKDAMAGCGCRST